MIELTPARRRELRAAAHHLNPVVTIAGQGLTAGVLAEIDRSLQAHELIKVKVQGADREVRETLLKDVCEQLDAASVQHIGNVLVLWRERREEDISVAAATTQAGPKTAPAATAKSARAFAAAARRAALIKASADKRRSAEKYTRGARRNAPATRGK